MGHRDFEGLRPWIAAVVLLVLAQAVAPGFCVPARADASSTGGIAGGFFSDDALAPPSQPIAPAPAGQMLPAPSGPDLCGPAVAAAAAGRNLPPGLLNAIAVVESGRTDPQSGRVIPWPWTIDANGTGYMYATKQAAEVAAAGFQAAGITSLDIGCLQVNLSQHPDAFQNLAQAFDPAANANYAAGFLTSLQQKFGNWPQAVAAYHSQTPGLGAPYQARVYAQWQGAGAPMALAAAAAAAPGGQMMVLPTTPLPQTAMQLSALIAPMPMPILPRAMHGPMHGLTGRSLASYRAAPVAIATSLAPPG